MYVCILNRRYKKNRILLWILFTLKQGPEKEREQIFQIWRLKKKCNQNLGIEKKITQRWGMFQRCVCISKLLLHHFSFQIPYFLSFISQSPGLRYTLFLLLKKLFCLKLFCFWGIELRHGDWWSNLSKIFDVSWCWYGWFKLSNSITVSRKSFHFPNLSNLYLWYIPQPGSIYCSASKVSPHHNIHGYSWWLGRWWCTR